MSSLTKEQLQRIEENRKKAMQLKSANTNQASSTAAPTAPFKGVPSSSFYSAKKPLDVQTVSHGPSVKRLKPGGDQNNIPQKQNGHQYVKNSNYQQSAEVVMTANNSGICKAISADRFSVNIGYNQQTIELFKQIPSKLYGMHITSCLNLHSFLVIHFLILLL
jgi:HepA-related protein (HARP)